jgi:hypothetical protein
MQERRTLGQTKEALEFITRLDALSQPQRDHLRSLIKKLVDAYLEDDLRAIIVLGRDEEEKSELFTVNCSEIEAANLLYRMSDFFTHMNTVDAPPKEMMN